MKRLIAKLAIVFIIPYICLAYSLVSHVIDCGSVPYVESNGYTWGGSTGQQLVGATSGGGYTLIAGFWTHPVVPDHGDGIAEEKLQNLVYPLVFSLNQNWPNPVRSNTRIKYSLATPCKVTLKLYDIVGRQVAVLIDAKQEAGYYVINWDIADVTIRTLANGVYFYRLKAGDFIRTRKLVLTR